MSIEQLKELFGKSRRNFRTCATEGGELALRNAGSEQIAFWRRFNLMKRSEPYWDQNTCDCAR